METDKEKRPPSRRSDKFLGRIITVSGIIVIACMVIYKEYFEEDVLSERGRYTIAEVTRVDTRIGRNKHRARAYFRYVLHGKRHSASYSDIGLNSSLAGRRYFVLVAPGETRRTRLYTDYPVPDWFTIAPPDTGWATIPADKELRLMVLRHKGNPNRAPFQ